MGLSLQRINQLSTNISHRSTPSNQVDRSTPSIEIPVTVTSNDPMIGECINFGTDQYRLVKHVGSGGMGAVYKAENATPGSTLPNIVAIKLLHGHTNNQGRERFEREIRTIVGLSDPGVVTTFGVGNLGDRTAIVMELLDSDWMPLRDVITHNKVRTSEEAKLAIEISVKVAEVLERISLKGIIHRDLKPENIMIRFEDGTIQIKILDFGLALSEDDATITQEHVGMGTIAYLAPEQATDAHNAAYCDTYALATILFEMLAGHTPFTGSSREILAAKQSRKAPRIQDLTPAVSPELALVVNGALETNPANRMSNFPRGWTSVTNQLRGAVQYSNLGVILPAASDATAETEDYIIAAV